MVHVCNEILLSYKKEHIWESSNEVDEPRAYYTEWSKLERGKQRSCINAYIWILERWYWWTHLQGSNGETDIRTDLWTQLGKERVGWIQRVVEGICWNTYFTICKIDGQWEFAVWCKELKPCVLWEPRGVHGVGWEAGGGSGRRGHVYTYGWSTLI